MASMPVMAAPPVPPTPFTMEFVRVPGGSFQLGCGAWQDHCYDDEEPTRTVTIAPFELGRYEVTQKQWRDVMGHNPSTFASCGGECPVDSVSWKDVQRFIGRLNARGNGVYRLPTEAEWEYACRSGGKAELYCGGSNPGRLGWYLENSQGYPRKVGTQEPNGLGLYDMTGNVLEWTCSVWAGYDDAGKHYERCGDGDVARVFRGGGWSNTARDVRSTLRLGRSPGNRYHIVGVRLVRQSP
jgi:formylglycine-generating enzyme required for sulfatase activity